MSFPDDAWLLARMPEHIRGAQADNAVAIVRQPSTLLRALFDAGVEWQRDHAVPIASSLDELELHDTDPAPKG